MESENKVVLFPENPEMEACEWVAKLDAGSLSANDAKNLSQWLDADSRNPKALVSQLEEWSDMDMLRELAHFNLNIDRPSFLDYLKKSLGVSKVLGFASGAIAVLALVVFVSGVFGHGDWMNYLRHHDSMEVGIVTLIGEQKKESLPDGSVVHVNTTSRANIVYTPKERSVVLHQGEAFFDIASEKDRPFVVYVGGAEVKAVGTAFAVQLDDSGVINVSVTEGVVEFMSAGKTILVSAENETMTAMDEIVSGNVVTYENTKTLIGVQPVDVLERRLGWQDGMLEFRGESLEYVVNELSRYTSAEIVIIDDDIKDVRLGGFFKIGDIAGLASTLELGFNIDVNVISDELIQVTRGR